jgi:hypothetical protein
MKQSKTTKEFRKTVEFLANLKNDSKRILLQENLTDRMINMDAMEKNLRFARKVPTWDKVADTSHERVAAFVSQDFKSLGFATKVSITTGKGNKKRYKVLVYGRKASRKAYG